MKIVFCLPGSNFSGRFLECWTDLVHFCLRTGITPMLSRRENPNVYFVRNQCLGADVMRGKNQKPFDGKIDYDYIMWLDSDILFRPEQVARLVNHNLDIVSGLYLMEGGKYFAAVRDWDEEFFKKNGYFQFLAPEDLKDKEELVEVAYAGMGFMLVKKGVFESSEYPWFEPRRHEIGEICDISSEDVGFCLKAKEKGFKVMVDPKIIVGHEKRVIL